MASARKEGRSSKHPQAAEVLFMQEGAWKGFIRNGGASCRKKVFKTGSGSRGCLARRSMA